MFSIHYTPLFYFGEVSFKNLILSDICGVGYGFQPAASIAGVINFAQRSRSEYSFLLI
ncbi:hypothetical protein LEP1GSC024_1263 [Leptospira noguchii str. 2001034031]|uniref:Uncharacterized protein n=1 Tax=Leptospira noguchii str. 2001034031 TaxID=1193053 RepID=M6YWJ5_9LEPT|nr:hypothetical protein LEP1GSC024_1263 [Leptospira noguchii str. 2001034031]